MDQVAQYGVAWLLDELASELRDGSWRPLPARRVFIPKPGTNEQRPLSIPAVCDRIVQAAVKIVLEPVFEAQFLPCSHQSSQYYRWPPRRSGTAKTLPSRRSRCPTGDTNHGSARVSRHALIDEVTNVRQAVRRRRITPVPDSSKSPVHHCPYASRIQGGDYIGTSPDVARQSRRPLLPQSTRGGGCARVTERGRRTAGAPSDHADVRMLDGCKGLLG
ncbi:hypothetical protein [Plantactinospora sp. DSM 117369]